MITGGSFPEGIRLGRNCPALSALLGEDCHYYDADGKKVELAAGQKEIAGYVTVIVTVRRGISTATVAVTAPEAGEEKQTAVSGGTGYSAAIEWDCDTEKFGYNTAYTATVTLTADENHKFTSGLTASGWNVVVSADGATATLTKTYEATRKEMLTEISAPKDSKLSQYYTNVADAIKELPTTVTYTTESGSVTVDIEWACVNYDSAVTKTNTFTWAVKNGELDNYDANGIATTGTITVTNTDAITVENSGENKTVTYNGSTYDVAGMFTTDKNAGEASYAIAGGTGAGTLNGSVLTITKAGTIEIKLTTAANGAYAAGEATATLTVQQKEISISWSNAEFTYDGSAHKPAATTNDFVLGDDVVLAVSGEKTDAGVDYTAMVTITGEDAGNYKFADGTATTTKFTINKADQAALTITGKPTGDIIYGDSFTLAAEGGSGDGVVSWTITEGSQHATVSADGKVSIIGVGTVKITATKAESANYKAATATYEFTTVKATPVLGEVTVSGVVKDTTKPADVVLIRTNTTVPGMLEITDSAMLANKSEYSWKFTPDDTANYNTVTGTVQIDVLDTVAPTVVIKVDENEWKEILNNFTFGLFFKDAQEVTITYTDNENGSGIMDTLYYVAHHELTDEELAAVEWETYNGTFNIDPDRKYVIYAKASDNDGNAVVINSDGIVLDETEAIISGITNGETYYGQVVFGVTDGLAGIASVEIDGVDKTHFEGQYVINPDNKEHTVVATDKAGNKTEYKITVYKNYTVTFMSEDGVYKTVTVKHGEKVTMPEVPKKDGYTVKWEKVLDTVTEDVTVKAVYTEIPATDKPSSPQTGDNSNVALWFTLLLLSGGAVITLAVYDRKRRKAVKH